MWVEWTELALEDLAAIQAYIAKDSPYYAKQLIERIFSTVVKLQNFPEIRRKVPEAGQQDNIRELIFHSYRILSLNEPDLVAILAVTHGNRDLTNLPKKPLHLK
ncbi:MAG: type II toxin-antitoxin system RelE/ParE family toxin [Methylococcales bacterium]